ncbi:MAG: fumarate hydratase [Deltaproteobacteria bacterium]
MPRTIDITLITNTVKKLFIQANTILPERIEECLKISATCEKTKIGRYVLESILENVSIAKTEKLPLCQDTGIANVFVDIGQDIQLVGGTINDAIAEGVRQAYADGYLRKSLCDPLTRQNTGDNTPAFIHYNIVAGDKIKIIAMPKGGGSENVSAVTMLTPSEGLAGIKKFVIEQIKKAGANPCPPIIVGIGIGASFDKVSILAKKALLRPVGEQNKNNVIAETERELLNEINNLGIGPAGYGGSISALAVHIDTMPCHIASLPVAVNIQCHVARYAEETI